MIPLEELKQLNRLEQLKQVNNRINRAITYLEDDVDTWRSPEELFKRGKGDCEDYSISKMAALIRLGWPKEDIRMCYTNYSNGIKQQAHMVLEVKLEGIRYVLDNMLNDIYTWEQRNDLKLVFTFNKTKLWVHDQLTEHDPRNRMKSWKAVVDRSEKEGWSLG